MSTLTAEYALRALPKAELHLHLEGSVEPATAVELAARHGVVLTEQEAATRYSYADFRGFLDAFKWVTSLLREPADYALVTRRLAERLLAQNVVYAEVTLSVGVMLWRRQDVEANFLAIQEAAQFFEERGLRLRWIFDAVRQFGPDPAMDVARWALRLQDAGVVAFGMGGDELSVPAAVFRPVYDLVANAGMHRVIHAGEVGGPESIRDAITYLNVERIGHGIALLHDEALRNSLAEEQTPVEVCPTSNVRTGALSYHLRKKSATAQEHPLAEFYRRGLLVTLSTDDPAMFQTSLLAEYAHAERMGMSLDELVHIAAWAFVAAFLPAPDKTSLLRAFHSKREALGL